MKATKFIVSTLASASLIGAIGFTYAQSSDSNAPYDKSNQPAAGVTPSTADTTGTAASNQRSSMDRSSTVSSSDTASNMPADTERDARADRG